MYTLKTFLVPAALAAGIMTGISPAHANPFETVRTHLYDAQTVRAIELAQSELAANPDDDQMRFALGAAQFLHAVEKLGQGLYRHGLASGGRSRSFGLGMLPVVRLPVPPNPNPEPITYGAFRSLLAGFVSDLEKAEKTLAGLAASTADRPVDLPIDLTKIHLDFDFDGKASEHENIAAILTTISRGRPGRPGSGTVTDFDAGDVVWLQGYSHLLMATGEFLLAHDWQEAFDSTFHSLFPESDLPSSPLLAEQERAATQLRELNQAAPKKPADMDQETWQKSEAYLQYQRRAPERRKLRQQAEFGNIADVIAFIHLNHWPVAEPKRMAGVLNHLETVSALSRENWRRILAETDNRNEWVPGPAQTGALAGMPVSQEQVEAWMKMLDELDALLAGKKLIPHWRFEGGINLRRFFLEPRTFDIVLLIQGSAALPYIEQGELTTEDTWNDITRAFGRNFLSYAVWFN